MTYDVTITGLNRITKPKAWNNGDTALALFDVDAGGFHLKQCVLIQRKSGALASSMPRGDIEAGPRMIYCHDLQLLDTITSAAKRAFEALGGKL
jgi:hypothetical protein